MSNKHYKRSGYIGIAIAAALLVIYLALGYTPFLSDDLITSEWFLDLLPIPLLASSIISSTTYIGKTCDLLATPHIKKSPYEKLLTPIFLLFGISVGIGLSVVLTIAKTFISILDTFVFTMNCISAAAGLGNRLGTIADQHNNRPTLEKSIMSIAMCFGILAVALTLAGVTSFFSGGTLLPVWLAGFMYISSVVSTADYSAKTFTQLLPHKWKSQQQKSIINNKKYEYLGSALGICLGITAALIVIVASHGIALIPALVILNTAMGGLGGFFSRLGRLLDLKNEKIKKNIIADANKFSQQTIGTIAPIVEPSTVLKPAPGITSVLPSADSERKLLCNTPNSSLSKSGKSPEIKINTVDNQFNLKHDKKQDDLSSNHSIASASPSKIGFFSQPTLKRLIKLKHQTLLESTNSSAKDEPKNNFGPTIISCSA